MDQTAEETNFVLQSMTYNYGEMDPDDDPKDAFYKFLSINNSMFEKPQDTLPPPPQEEVFSMYGSMMQNEINDIDVDIGDISGEFDMYRNFQEPPQVSQSEPMEVSDSIVLDESPPKIQVHETIAEPSEEEMVDPPTIQEEPRVDPISAFVEDVITGESEDIPDNLVDIFIQHIGDCLELIESMSCYDEILHVYEKINEFTGSADEVKSFVDEENDKTEIHIFKKDKKRQKISEITFASYITPIVQVFLAFLMPIQYIKYRQRYDTVDEIKRFLTPDKEKFVEICDKIESETFIRYCRAVQSKSTDNILEYECGKYSKKWTEFIERESEIMSSYFMQNKQFCKKIHIKHLLNTVMPLCESEDIQSIDVDEKEVIISFREDAVAIDIVLFDIFKCLLAVYNPKEFAKQGYTPHISPFEEMRALIEERIDKIQ